MKQQMQTYRAFFIFVFLAGFLVACEGDRPDGLLSEEEMVPIVMDLQIAYAGVDATIRNPKNRPEKYKELNALILEKHQINKDRFYGSFEYYQQHPALMDTIYQKVIDQLSADIIPLQNPEKKRPKGRVPEAK